MIRGLRTAKRTPEQLKEAQAALDESFLKYKSVGQIAADTQFVYECSELIRQLAVEQFKLSDPTPMFVQRESAELGATIELEEIVNTMKAVRRHPGSTPLAFTPTKRKLAITTSQYDVSFSIDLEKILRRQITASVFAQHAAEATSRLYVETVLGAIDAAVTGNDHYGNSMRTAGSGDVTAPNLDAAIRRLGDVNGSPFIAGRYTALFPITTFAGYTNQQIFGQDQLNEIHQTGLIGMYKGAKVVVLRDDYNFFYGKASIPSDRIYLGGADKGAFLHERDVSALSYQSLDTERAMIKTGLRLDFGVTVAQPWKYHIITL